MKPNVIVALLLGLVIGFAVGRVMTSPSAAPQFDESKLTLKSGDMPAGTFTGMTDAQKYAVMKVMNDNVCSCGCGLGTLANCVKSDPKCPNSPKKLAQAVALAKQGKTAEQIQQEMFGSSGAQVAQQQQQQAPKPPPIEATIYPVPVEGSPVLGNPSAPITIVEFSDYQCPYCSRANVTVEQVRQEFGDKVRVVMKQFPLGFHPFAKGAALAALAAGEQGKYWEMHAKLFANQTALDDASLQKYAEQIGLNVAKFNKDRQDPKLQKVIEADQALGGKLGIQGTPGFFVNGRKIPGAYPVETFRQTIGEEMPKAEALLKQGVQPKDVYAKLMASAHMPTGPFARVDAPADSPSFGPRDAKVTIVEWSDFQCPYCGRAAPTVDQLKAAYPKDVKFVFRNQPLGMHQYAQLAAEASLAAHEQGKFWEMHDKMFGNQRALDRASLEQYAQQIGLDMTKFKAALDSGKFKARIAQDSQAGNTAGAGGTPTFFVNGRMFVGALGMDQFKSVIDQEIAKADALLKKGVKMDALYQKLLDENGGGEPAAK